MKKLIALIAVLGFVPYAHAADGADFSHSGDFRLQYQNDMNMDGNDDGVDSPKQNWHQRLRWGSAVRVGEKLSANFTLVHNADWGGSGVTNQYPSNLGADADLDGVQDASETSNTLLVNEAYMTWVMNDSWMLRAGRGSMTMADGRFISANEWENVNKAYEGVLATYDHEMVRLNLSATMGAKDSSNNRFNTFGRFYGVSADFKTLPEFLKAAHVHVYQVKQDENLYGQRHRDVMRIGAMLSGEMSGADYRFNYEMEDGETERLATDTADDVSTSMMDLEVGYTLAAMMNTRLFANYHTDSGSSKAPADQTDDETYDPFHYNSHDNSGLMDVIGWGNLTYTRFGLSMQPVDDIDVGFEYLMFSQTEKKDVINGTGAFGGNGDETEDDLGTEMTLTVKKKYTNNFHIEARYGMFSPGDEYKAANMEDNYEQLYLETKLTF